MKQDTNRRLRTIARVILIAALLTIPVAVGAQSCAMCYQNAAASGPRTIHAINNGILILMFPPAVITFGICYLAYKKRDSFDESA